MKRPGLKVGEVAKRTGLTVRTLHHYDEIGLLTPSEKTDSGHRLYTDKDLMRLQQIVSLKQLGFQLEEISGLLKSNGYPLKRVVDLHLASAREQLQKSEELCRRLQVLSETLSANGEVSVEQLVATIQVTNMYEKYFTPEQLAEIKERARQQPDAKQSSEREWKELIAQMKAEMDKGTDPADPRVLEIAKRWNALIESFTGGDAKTRESLSKMYQSEPKATETFLGPGIGKEIFVYAGKAMAALKKG